MFSPVCMTSTHLLNMRNAMATSSGGEALLSPLLLHAWIWLTVRTPNPRQKNKKHKLKSPPLISRSSSSSSINSMLFSHPTKKCSRSFLLQATTPVINTSLNLVKFPTNNSFRKVLVETFKANTSPEVSMNEYGRSSKHFTISVKQKHERPHRIIPSS